MKVVIATPLYPPDIGGPATYAALLEAELPKRGIEVEVVKFGAVRHLPKLIRHIAYYRRVRAAARRADVVLALDPVSVGLPASRAARRAKKPFVVKIVGDYAWEQAQQRFGITDSLDEFLTRRNVPLGVALLRRVELNVARSAVRIIVPSDYLKGVVTAWGVGQEKIRVVYNAVSINRIGVVPPAIAGLPRPLVVTAGRLVPWKHVDGVIDAMASGASLGSLVVVGDGPERARLETRAQEVLSGRCLFIGTLPHVDLLAVIQTADRLVLNSSYEGLSHLLVEAALLGTSIVATDAGGNREVVREGENGRLVPVGDTAALAAALHQPVPRRRIEETRFKSDTMIEGTIEVLQNV